MRHIRNGLVLAAVAARKIRRGRRAAGRRPAKRQRLAAVAFFLVGVLGSVVACWPEAPWMIGQGARGAGRVQAEEALRQGENGFDPVTVLAEPLPPLTDFRVVPARAGERELDAFELVLGVTVGGASRAYAINMLTGPKREILNDQLGGTPIAATW